MIRMSDHFAQILHIDDDDAWTKVGRGSKQMFCSIFWLKAGDGIGYNSFWTKISRRCKFGPISPPGADILVNKTKSYRLFDAMWGLCLCLCLFLWQESQNWFDPLLYRSQTRCLPRKVKCSFSWIINCLSFIIIFFCLVFIIFLSYICQIDLSY